MDGFRFSQIDFIEDEGGTEPTFLSSDQGNDPLSRIEMTDF